MTKVVHCERFLLLRAAAQQLRAAASLREMAASAQVLRDSVTQSCDQARQVLDAAAERTKAYRLYSDSVSRLAERLETADLDEMIATRDELLRLMAEGCAHCDGASPFADRD